MSLRTIMLLAIPPVLVMVAYGVSTVGSSTETGRVPIPGKRVVELPAGKTALYYEERRNLEEGSGTPVVDEADFLEIPLDLEVSVTARGGRELAIDRTSFGSVVEDEQGSRKVFAKVEVPRAGSYTVTAGPIDRRAPDPAVTFGVDALSEFLPWALAALAALALGGLVAAALAFADRRRGV